MNEIKLRKVHHKNEPTEGARQEGYTVSVTGLSAWEADILLAHLNRSGLSRPTKLHVRTIGTHIKVGIDQGRNLVIHVKPTAWSEVNNESILTWLGNVEHEVRRWGSSARPVLWQVRDMIDSQINEAASRLAEVEESLSKLEDELNADKQDTYEELAEELEERPPRSTFTPTGGRVVTLLNSRPRGGLSGCMGLIVGPDAMISREYVEDLREEGWRGLDQIPDEWIVDTVEGP